MEDEVSFILESSEESMQSAVVHLEDHLSNLRAGKANPNMLNGVMVEYYGAQTPLNQVANVTAPDSQTLSVQPFDKSAIPEIEKGVHAANLGLNPMNNGDSIIITIPTLTEERRKDLVRKAKSEAEEAKVGVRNDRKSANNELKKLELSEDALKAAEDDVQKLTDKFTAKIDETLTHKEKEIMTV
jgi:ribosome recycling factor